MRHLASGDGRSTKPDDYNVPITGSHNADKPSEGFISLYHKYDTSGLFISSAIMQDVASEEGAYPDETMSTTPLPVRDISCKGEYCL